MVVDVMISQKKIPPDKIFPRSYMDFEQKYQKDPGIKFPPAILFHFANIVGWVGGAFGDGQEEGD